MDAAQKLFKNSAILTAATLLLAIAGLAQTPSLSVPTTVSLVGTGGQTVQVASTGDPITYTIGATTYLDTDTGWLRLDGSSPATTPQVVSFGLLRAPATEGAHQATVTLTPTSPAGVAAVTITITYTSGTSGGGGTGGGTFSASPSPLFISTGLNSVTSPTTVTISTSGSTTVVINSVSTNITTGSTSWLTAAIANATVSPGSPGSITVTAYSTGLASGTYTGTVTVTPNTGNALTINVNFTVGSGGGGNSGNWSVSPSTISWNYVTGSGFQNQLITVTPPSGATYYNVSTTSSNGWLLASVNGSDGLAFNQIPIGTNFFLKLGSNVNALTQGQYTGQALLTDSSGNSFTLNVTLTVNGGNSSGLVITPNPLTFNASLNSGQQQQAVSITSNVGGDVTVTGVGTTPGWLTATGPSPANISALGTATFTVFANPAGLAAGTYSAGIAITVGSQAGTLTVNLVVGGGGGGGTGTTNVAPSSLNFAYQFGTNIAFIAQQKLVIVGPAGSWSSQISNGATWLRLTPGGGSSIPNPAVSGDTPIVSVDPTGLAVGSYSGTISVTTPGGTQQVSVSLNVVSGGIIIPTPGALIFNAQTGQGNPTGQSVFFSASDSSLNPLSITATSNNSWISVTNGLTNVSVQVDQTGLGTGVYSGSFSVTQTGAANSPTLIPVLLVVNGGGNGGGSTGTLSFSQNPITFSSVNGSIPNSTVLTVSAASATSFVGSISYANGSNWLSVSPLSAVTNANLSVSANPSGLASGTYNATISFNSSGVIQSVGVTLTVNNSGGGGNTGNVTLSPTSLTFSTQQGSSPASQAFTVSSASGASGVNFTVQVTTGSNWLSTSANANNTTPATFNAIVNSNVLQAGSYTGNIVVTPSGGTAVNLPVSLTVTAPPTVSATPTSLTFDYRAGDNAPAAKQITVSGGGATLVYAVTASSNGNWLVATPAAGTTPGTVNASINPSGLSTGVYNGTIIVAGAAGASGSTTISVTLNVTAPLPTLTRVTNAASYNPGSISPGEIVTLFAADPTHPIGPATPAGLTLDSTGKVSTTIGGVQVLINGFACPMVYASATQVSAVVPYELKVFTSATVLVKFLGQSSNGVLVNVATTTPGVFTANSSGTGPGAILNSNSTTNSAGNPATRGDTIVVYLTGEGETTPPGVTGKVTTIASPPQPLTPAPLLPVSVTIGGQPANWSFAGEAPGFVSGVLQLNVIVPTNIPAGDQVILVTIGGNQSQLGVTVSLR